METGPGNPLGFIRNLATGNPDQVGIEVQLGPDILGEGAVKGVAPRAGVGGGKLAGGEGPGPKTGPDERETTLERKAKAEPVQQ